MYVQQLPIQIPRMRHRTNVYVLLFVCATIVLTIKISCRSTEHNASSWDPKNTIIILSNRVPKCGSHLTRTIIKRLSRETHAYGSENSENHGECRLSNETQQQLREELLEKAQNAHHHRFVYDRHFHFVNFVPEPGVTFSYINQLRDPIDQLVSGYYYNRYICMVTNPEKQCTYYPPSIFNLTLDECVSTGDPMRCITKPYGAPEYLIYFCGQSSICNNISSEQTSNAALSLAKTNIERYYMYIGLLEYVQNSFEILEHLQPSIFSGLVRTYHKMKDDERITSVPENFRHRPNNKTREILRQLLAPEYELYEFVRERFFRQYSQIFHRAPTRST